MIPFGRNQGVLTEPENSDQVATPATKHKDVAGERTLREGSLDPGAEPVHAAPHIGVPGGDPDVSAGAWGYHDARQSD